MKCPTQIEQDLFDYLSPAKQAEVEEFLNEEDFDKKLSKMVDDEIEAKKLDRIDRKDEAARLMVEGENIEICELCGRLKNS